ncbi:hypothetical protein SLEP1_g32620 [Rubroshorea leprosula]|uniref:Formin-like protein n=1 Tax=Rubroshorea leprosula TaxID=152421 RepID=A0AAV5KDX2_9ROSI|nr:hypothetical protein SLEP1_g32620 [Rubroshorea leprosula]
MAAVRRPLVVVFVLLVFVLPFKNCQSESPQNIETSYPVIGPPPAPEPAPEPIPGSPTVVGIVPPPTLPPPSSKPGSSSSDGEVIVKAVAASAVSTLVVATVFFFLVTRFLRRKRGVGGGEGSGGGGGGFQEGQFVVTRNEFGRFDGNVKGLIVDENGLDVLYWRKLEDGNRENGFQKKSFDGSKDERQDDRGEGGIFHNQRWRKVGPTQEIPLLRGKSSISHVRIHPEDDDVSIKITAAVPTPPPSAGITLMAVGKKEPPIQPPNPPPPIPALAPPPKDTRKKIPSPPPPPVPGKKIPAPPPPPVPGKKIPAPPPPLPKRGGDLTTSLKPPGSQSKPEESSAEGSENGQVKLKPLHWDKVNKMDHSMVWDKIEGGSFRFDGELMEALFGVVATNKKSPDDNDDPGKRNGPVAGLSAQITILDHRRSQNVAIVLRSVAISRRELLDVLTDGEGLDTDTLEKLTSIAPTEEEQSKILGFSGDPLRLPDAESFLYHLLKAIPSAFKRVNAMLFRSNYEAEILQVKEYLQTLEAGCKELRTQGLFIKLLEAILKAGNRMNAGTTRGNAQAFKLTSLRKLSDVKSTDGKTTLLHFVVEEVVRFEGKRCVLCRNRSLGCSSRDSNSSLGSEQNSELKEEKEREYMTLGLPIVGGLSVEFSNVKKAAAIDFVTFSSICSSLTARTAEIRKVVSECSADGEGRFVREIKGFLDAAEEELKALKEEQQKVMHLVKRTTAYYHAEASTDQGAQPLHLFVIVTDFLGMVDRVCIEIARNLQKRKSSGSSQGSQSPNSTPRTMRFPNLPLHFLRRRSGTSSSDSDSD